MPLRLFWRARKNRAYNQHILERFGLNVPLTNQSIWVHVVSVGEAISAAPLIKALLELYPTRRMIVTTMTPTGRDRLEHIFANQITLLYLPYDYPFAIKRFLRQINPKLLIIMETELWPNLIYYTHRNKIPILLANARLSQKSYGGYQKIASLTSATLNYLDLVLAQSKLDGERFLSLGLKKQRLKVIGNIKFDLEIAQDLISQATSLRESLGTMRPTWIAASTHKFEEEKVLSAAKAVLAIKPDALLILVPRHPERFDEVYNLSVQQGFKVARFSNLSAEYKSDTNLLLGDVMGQLLMLYAISDIAFVGGSLVPWGGHNLLEPASLSKPVLSGNHLSAFLEVSQILIDHEALVVVSNEDELAKKVIELFNDVQKREVLGARALDVVEKYRGSTKKILAAVEELCG